jgi:hypothetical protein
MSVPRSQGVMLLFLGPLTAETNAGWLAKQSLRSEPGWFWWWRKFESNGRENPAIHGFGEARSSRSDERNGDLRLHLFLKVKK